MDMNMDMMTDLFVKAMAGGADAPKLEASSPKKESGDNGLDMMFMMMEMMGEMMKSGSAPPPGMGSVPPPPAPFPPQGGMMPPQGSPFPQPMAPAVPMFPGVNAPPPGQVAAPGMMPQQAMPGMMPQQQAMPGMMPMGANPMDPLAGADSSIQGALSDITTKGNISNASLMNLSAGIGSLHKSAIPMANQAAMTKSAQQNTSPQAIMGASQQSAAAPPAAGGALGGALPGAGGGGAQGGLGGLGGALGGL